MIKIFRDLTYIIRECKLFLVHVLFAIKFIKCQQSGFTKACFQVFWLHQAFLRSCPTSLLRGWPAQARVPPGGTKSQQQAHLRLCFFVAFWGMRLQCVNTILYFIAIPGLWAWSHHDSGVLITDSWCCQAVAVNNKLLPKSGPSVWSFWHVASMGGEISISF